MLRQTLDLESLYPASPKIDHLFSLAKLNVLSSREYQSQQEQISLIRTLGRDIFGEVEDQNFTERDQMDKTVSFNTVNKKKIVNQSTAKKELYKNDKLNDRKQLQTSSANQTVLKDYYKKSRQIQGNKTTYLCSSKYKNPSKKQERFLKEVLKKRIDEEQQKDIEKNIKKNQQVNTTIKTKKKVESKCQNDKEKHNKKRTKQEVALSFQAVLKRGQQTMKRKESNALTTRQQLYRKDMNQITFEPHFQSSEQMRQNHSRSFYERIEEDVKNRDKQKTFILRDILDKNPFKPRLNEHANANSRSKINSIRLKDEKFVKKKVTSIQILQKMMMMDQNPSQNEWQLINTDRNILTQVPVVTNDLSFLLQ